ncbi:MAG: hypothetical protein Q4C96_01030 [Planctomycetia bacterium]|nr:hypothetical protein [Planctomycetia bacterium]
MKYSFYVPVFWVILGANIVFSQEKIFAVYSPENISVPHAVLVSETQTFFAGEILEIKNDCVEMETLEGEILQKKLESLAGIIFTPPGTKKEWDIFIKIVFTARKNTQTDILWLENGDYVHGFFVEMKDGVIFFEKLDAREKVKLEIPAKRIKAVIFAGFVDDENQEKKSGA